MTDAKFIPGMNYLSYWIEPNEFGDTNVSKNCYSLKEAKTIIKETKVNQGLIVSDFTKKYDYKRIF